MDKCWNIIILHYHTYLSRLIHRHLGYINVCDNMRRKMVLQPKQQKLVKCFISVLNVANTVILCLRKHRGKCWNVMYNLRGRCLLYLIALKTQIHFQSLLLFECLVCSCLLLDCNSFLRASDWSSFLVYLVS